MSDYEILFAMWIDPKINLTTWRQQIEATLKDEIRYRSFRKETKESKVKSSLHRAFYLSLKMQDIGHKTKDEAKCLSKLEQCLLDIPDHPSIQEAVATAIMLVRSGDCELGDDDQMMDITNSKEYARAKALFSQSAYQGYKPAIRQLNTALFISDLINSEYPTTCPHIFTDTGTDWLQDDPFYALAYLKSKLQLDLTVYPEAVNTIIRLNMPLNNFSFEFSFLLCCCYQMFHMESIENEKDRRSRAREKFFRPHFIRLCEYINPHLTTTRILPRKRDPFSIYREEFSSAKCDEITQLYVAAKSMAT